MRTHSAGHWAALALLIICCVLASVSSIDRAARDDLDAIFGRALVSFALARTLNGVISAAQGTEVALQPAGMGLTLTPGEVLDPVNDLVERFSWIMLGATISLGIQNILMDISSWWLIKLLVWAFAAWFMLLFVLGRADSAARSIAIRALIVALFLRFAVPISLVANQALYDIFLEYRYEQATEVVTDAGGRLRAVSAPEKQEGLQDGGGWVDHLGRVLNSTREKLDIEERIAAMKASAGEIIEHVIWLAVVFLFQTAVLPIAFLWLLLKFCGWLFRSPLYKN